MLESDEESSDEELKDVKVIHAKRTQQKTISEKQFYKEMQKLKDRGTGAVPPKKSASAYIIFGKEKRSEILRRNPLSKVTEVVKEIAKCWGLMSKEDKHKYKEAAKRGKWYGCTNYCHR